MSIIYIAIGFIAAAALSAWKPALFASISAWVWSKMHRS